jgi:hypothetical protein
MLSPWWRGIENAAEQDSKDLSTTTGLSLSGAQDRKRGESEVRRK